MIRRSIWKLLGYYISGNTMPDKEKVETWISGNDRRQHIVEDLDRFKSMVDVEGPDENSKKMWDLFQERKNNSHYITAETYKPAKTIKLFPRSGISKLAAAIAFLIAIGGALFYYFNGSWTIHVQMVEAKSSLHDKKKLTLPDGTLVWLNSNSSIKYPESFRGQDKRTVYLSGEAYFDVTHNNDQPFVVNTSNFHIEVLGTSFNVKSYPNDDKQVATLVRGSIKLNTMNVCNKKYREILLTPNQQVTFSKSKKQIKLDMTEADVVASWMEKKFKFKHVNFLEISNKLSMAYQVKFFFSDPALKDLAFTGSINRSDSISQIMNVIKEGFPINYEIKGDSVFIHPKK